jgi:hypothetical protein
MNGLNKHTQGQKLLKFHPYGPGGYAAGYPDWTILGPHGLLLRELKREGKDPTVEQQEWLEAFRNIGLDADVWRPRDLLSGRIAQELTAISALGRKASPKR